MLDPLYHLAADAIVFFHKGFGPIFGDDSFFSWALSVMLLVVCVRILIFPLFVKQVKSQRTMQMMQPLIKEIKEKYGHDKPRMQQEMMALQKEHGNPLLGCLPLLLQIPLFFALFSVFNKLKPMEIDGVLQWRPRVGLSAEQIEQIAEAKVFGISLSTAFTSPQDFLNFIVADGLHVKIAAVVLIVLMGATTFFTQKQIMARTGPVDPQQAMIQKVMLYGSPLALAVFGFNFPIAVLLYWLTTNLWSMGQQFFVIKKMPPLQPLGKKSPGARPDGDAVAVSKPKVGVKPQRDARRQQPPGRSGAGKPATGTQPSLSKGASTGGGAKSAPRGTRSPSGTASGSAKKNGVKPAPGAATGSGAGSGDASPKLSKPTAKTVDSASAARSANGVNPKPASTTGTDAVSSNGSSPAELSSRDVDAAQSQSPSKDTTGRTGGSPVGTNARRQPSGSRPARKKNRGKRPGGRH